MSTTGANNTLYDIIIIGGSYAGLSAAMALGRSLRKTLVIDAGKPCNANTPRSHNLLTQDGTPPAEIAGLAKEQVQQYDTVSFEYDYATSCKKTATGFEVTTQAGDTYKCKKLILASGIKDELPDIPGVRECWGISVIHCPYCHGYEYRSKRTGIMANGDAAMHLAPMVANLTSELTVFTNGKSELTSEQQSRLNKNNIKVIEAEVAEIVHSNGYLTSVRLADGTDVSLDALYAKIPFSQHSSIPEALGCELNEFGFIRIDDLHKTTVEGVYACGDNCNLKRSVANAIAAGNYAAAIANRDLAEEEF